jgi:hypothetical protein
MSLVRVFNKIKGGAIKPLLLLRRESMKSLYLIITLILLGCNLGVAREFFPLGIPEPVTVTTTDMALDEYTQLLDSDLSCSKIYITNLDAASQDIRITYNSLTWTVVDDYITLAAGATIERDGQTANGVYCGVTATAGAISTKVKFESWK